MQQQLTSSLALEVAYVGNVGRHLFEAHQPQPGGSRSGRFQSSASVLQLFRARTRSLSVLQLLQFELQLAADQASEAVFARPRFSLDLYLVQGSRLSGTKAGGNTPANTYDRASDYGPASWDREHVVTFTHNLDLPFGRNRRFKLGGNLIADAILGGWRLSGVHTFGSGLPFTPTVSNAPLAQH